jgi:hypothetical protein
VKRNISCVGKVIAIGPGGRAQAPVRDDRCRPVIEFVLAGSLLDRPLLSPMVPTIEKAAALEKALYRSARYYCSCQAPYCTRKHSNVPSDRNPRGGCPAGGQRISCRADVVRVPGEKGYRVQFRMFDKREAMRAVVQRYGPDPNQWPYYARRKRLKEGSR